MRTRSWLTVTSLAAGLALGAGCSKKGKGSDDPQAGDNLMSFERAEDDFVGDDGGDDEFGDDMGDDMGEGEEGEPGEAVAEDKPKLEKLPPRAKAKKRCRGKGKKRKCSMVDPKPRVSAAYGVRTLMGEFRWGMSPEAVIKVLSADVDKEYQERQKKAKSPSQQDRVRTWKKEQVQAIKGNHQRFRKGINHRWGVSLIQYEYADDNQEEMVWVKTTPTLRKFYFFKDGELWKIFYAYATDTWPGKTYKEVVEEKFKKWFGPSPKVKDKKDPKSGNPVVVYNEWLALKGELIRSFDMTNVHGVIVLAVIDGNAEKSIGERLPNVAGEEGFSDVVGDVLGGTDVCYNKEGDIVECGKGDVDIP